MCSAAMEQTRIARSLTCAEARWCSPRSVGLQNCIGCTQKHIGQRGRVSNSALQARWSRMDAAAAAHCAVGPTQRQVRAHRLRRCVAASSETALEDGLRRRAPSYSLWDASRRLCAAPLAAAAAVLPLRARRVEGTVVVTRVCRLSTCSRLHTTTLLLTCLLCCSATLLPSQSPRDAHAEGPHAQRSAIAATPSHRMRRAVLIAASPTTSAPPLRFDWRHRCI